jgi:hypothetical protein
MKRVMEIGTAIIGMALVTRVITRPNNVTLISQMGENMSSMVKAMNAGTAIHSRRENALNYLGRLGTSEQVKLYADLTDEDLDWVIEQLGNVSA